MESVQIPLLEPGQIFASKADLLDYVQTVAVVTHCGFQTIKSDTKRISLVCRHRLSQQCPWKLYASEIPGPKYAIKTLCNDHQCTGDNSNTSTQATAQWVANRVEGHLRNQKSFNNKAIQDDIRERYGVKISSDIAAGAKKIALRCIYGAIDQAYELLPDYASMIERTNPGSLSKVITDGDGRFAGYFVAYACHLQGFAWCRPLIFLDGGFIKESHGGQILAATTLDANGQLFPLAMAVVRSESEGSWSFLLNNLRNQLEVSDTLNFAEGLTIMSDRAKGLINAVEEVFPEAAHGYCLRHLYQNYFNRFKGNIPEVSENFNVKSAFYNTANALTILQYEAAMELLESELPGSQEYLESAGTEHWSAVHFRGTRYGYSNSNPAESINAWLVHERELPIIEMMEEIRRKLTKWIWERGQQALLVRPPRLANKAEYTIEIAIKQGRALEVRPSGTDSFEVINHTITSRTDIRRSFVVNTAKWECSCNVWQNTQIPCSHAASAIMQYKRDDVRLFASKYFTADYWQKAYSHNIIPLPDRADWSYADCERIEGNQSRILAPLKRIKRGRPKKKRIASMLEDDPSQQTRRQRCGFCGEYSAHNRRGCPQAQANTPMVATQSSDPVAVNAIPHRPTLNHIEAPGASVLVAPESSLVDPIPTEPILDSLPHCIVPRLIGPRRNESRRPTTHARGRIGTDWGTIISHEMIDDIRWYWVQWDHVSDRADNPTRHLNSEFRSAGELRWTLRYCKMIGIVPEL